MIDFTTLKALTIPEGEVIKIERGNEVLWELITSRIPKEYQEVEWLYSKEGMNQHMDLGFSFDTKARIYISQWIFSMNGTADYASTYPFGAAEKSGALRCMLSSPYSSTASLYGSTGTAYNRGYVRYDSEDPINGHKYEFCMNLEPSNLYIENIISGVKSTVQTNQGDYTMTNNMYLFAQNYNGTPRYGGARKIGTFQYYDKNDNLICDLVPCYRKSDSVAGMYDLARNVFLTNVGQAICAFGIGTAIGNTTEPYTNLALTSTDDDGNVYNCGTGFKEGCRWSSSGGAPVEGGSYGNDLARLSGWVPYERGATYRFKNFRVQDVDYANGAYVIYKKTDGSFLVHATGKTSQGDYNVDSTNDICTFTPNLANVEYFRISGLATPSLPIITKNEEII